MRVLVTGAQGCIGSWVVRQLLDRSIDVLSYDQNPDLQRLSLIASPDEVRRVAIHTGAIEDGELLKVLVRDSGITHIVHLAASLIPYCQANPVKGALANVIGTLNVFEAARTAGRAVRVVYASSAAVWGPEDTYGDHALTESDVLLPGTHYGVFKQANEGNARVFHKLDGISSVGLRPWSVYGLGRDFGLTADPTLAAKAVVLKRPFEIRVTGKMDLQYVEDVAAAFVGALLSPVEGAHVFNLEVRSSIWATLSRCSRTSAPKRGNFSAPRARWFRWRSGWTPLASMRPFPVCRIRPSSRGWKGPCSTLNDCNATDGSPGLSDSTIDIEQPEELVSFLRARGIVASHEQPVLRTLKGGVSNRTVLVECPQRAGFVVKQALSRLRVAVEWYADPQRIHREARALEHLCRLVPARLHPGIALRRSARASDRHAGSARTALQLEGHAAGGPG